MYGREREAAGEQALGFVCWHDDDAVVKFRSHGTRPNVKKGIMAGMGKAEKPMATVIVIVIG